MRLFRWLRRHKILATLLALVLLTGALLPAFFALFTVVGPSEAPTVLIGDRVLVSRAAYDLCVPYREARIARTGTPERGELILFVVPNREPGMLGIKRVIGVPGDRVEVRQNQLIINGEAVPADGLDADSFDWVPKDHGLGSEIVLERLGARPYAVGFTPGKNPLRNCAAVTVPPDHFFVLGDNRDTSNDSRTFGPLPRDLVKGKVLAVLR